MDMQVAALDILTTKGGFEPAAARAIGEAMDLQIARSYEDLATNQRLDETRVLLKGDITAVEVRLDSVRMELKGDITAVEVRLDSVRMELKGDIAAVDAKVDRFRLELKADIAAVDAKVDRFRMELKADIAAVDAKVDRFRLELKADIAALEQRLLLKIEEAKTQFLRWMLFAMMTQTATLAALMRLFMPHAP
jgi:hypothetical protein